MKPKYIGRDRLSKVPKSEGDSIESLIQSGLQLLQKGRLRESAQIYKYVLTRNPKNYKQIRGLATKS